MEDASDYLAPTRLLDFRKPELVKKREQLISFSVSKREEIKKLYEYVSSLPLGYSRNDNIAASHVLKDGYGQCNTKVTLMMAMCRGAGIPCRMHAYQIAKGIQHGRIPEWMVKFAPQTTLFTWPEFFVEGSWQPLQSFVHVEQRQWASCPFDGARWQLEPLHKEWIVRDEGVWKSQDEYFRGHKPTIYGWRAIGWHLFARRIMNRQQNAC